MNFGEALNLLLKSKNKNCYMKRPEWDERCGDSDIMTRVVFKNRGGLTNKCLIVCSRFGEIPWIPNMAEMCIFDDWIVCNYDDVEVQIRHFDKEE